MKDDAEYEETYEPKIVVITEAAVQILTLPSNGGKMKAEEVLQLPGKGLKTQRGGSKHWKYQSNLLILTVDDDSFSLWSLDKEDLKL